MANIFEKNGSVYSEIHEPFLFYRYNQHHNLLNKLAKECNVKVKHKILGIRKGIKFAYLHNLVGKLVNVNKFMRLAKRYNAALGIYSPEILELIEEAA